MKDTAVSLIIPIYNADAYLQACLDSVTEQTLFPRMQVLLIDDGSTDASPEICDVYAQKYANIYVSHRRNASAPRATPRWIWRWASISRSRTRTICCCRT